MGERFLVALRDLIQPEPMFHLSIVVFLVSSIFAVGYGWPWIVSMIVSAAFGTFCWFQRW